MYIHTLMSVK